MHQWQGETSVSVIGNHVQSPTTRIRAPRSKWVIGHPHKSHFHTDQTFKPQSCPNPSASAECEIELSHAPSFPLPPSPSPPPPHSNRLLIVQHSADGREIYPPRSRQSSISRVPTVNFLNEFWQDALGRGGGEWNPSRPTDHDNSAWDFAFWYSTRCHLLPRPLAHPDWRSNSSCPI